MAVKINNYIPINIVLWIAVVFFISHLKSFLVAIILGFQLSRYLQYGRVCCFFFLSKPDMVPASKAHNKVLALVFIRVVMTVDIISGS